MSKELSELEKITLLGVKQVLTTEEAVMLTGLSVSTLHKLTSTKQIPHYKSRGGKINYYDKVELTKWMLSCRIKTTEELEDEALAYITSQK